MLFVSTGWVAGSGCGDGRWPDLWIMAQWGEGFQRHVAPADGPFVVLLEEDGADEAGDGGLVGMPTTSVRRLISPFSRSRGFVEWSFERCWAGKVM